MKLKVLSVGLFALSLFSCSDDPEVSINGSWKLTNATLSNELNLEYREGEVIWSFDEKDHILTVTNNIMTDGPENIYSGLTTGNYTYNIQHENGIEMLYINGSLQGAMATTSDNLVINSDPEQDNGLTKVFSR